jgi:hypothetical protein
MLLSNGTTSCSKDADLILRFALLDPSLLHEKFLVLRLSMSTNLLNPP